MNAALQIYSRDFDADFFALPADLQARIEVKIDQLGMQLNRLPHTRMKGLDCYRMRIGDYWVIQDFDLPKDVLYLLTVGHRREVYRRCPSSSAGGARAEALASARVGSPRQRPGTNGTVAALATARLNFSEVQSAAV